ncbi:hypothetical protein P3S68_024044 [Capsicum galapagoense]
MVRRVHRAVKRPASTASTSRKRKSEEVLKTSKRKKFVVDESESKTKSRIFFYISKYYESSAHESEDAEDSEGKSEGDSGDGEEDPLSLPICARDISVESYGLTTWIDDLGSFPAKISVRVRMTVYREFRRVLVEQKLYCDFKKTCFGHLSVSP